MMLKKIIIPIILLFPFLIFNLSCHSQEKHDYDIVFVNGLIIDGTGNSAYRADIGIADGIIKKIGKITKQGKVVVDIEGKIISPGFIDTHSHHDEGMFKMSHMLAAVSQGITTIFIGQDGFSDYPLSELVDRIHNHPIAVNIASFIGHNTIRANIMRDDYKRKATIDEIRRMEKMLSSELESGAWGLSSGLEYDPGIYSGNNEIISLAKIASRNKSRYISHIRSEDRYFWSAIDEIISIGKEAQIPVQISHIKLAMKSLINQTDRLLEVLNNARSGGIIVSADIYPYTYWQSTMQVLFPKRDFNNKSSAEFALTEITSPEGVIVSEYTPSPNYKDMLLSEIAELLNQDPSELLMNMIDSTLDNDHSESIIAKSMSEEDIVNLLKWDYTNLCSDGGATGGHPRGYGSFTKVLGEYVRGQELMSFEEAIYKMSGASSKNMGLKGRGILKENMAADIVVFDPEKVKDRATFYEPLLLSEGIIHVLVNGKFILKNKKITDHRPGVFLDRFKHHIGY